VPTDASALTEARAADCYDGEPAAAIAGRLDLPAVHLYATIGSTMDAAHRLGAAGVPAGALVLADAQTAGRGRHSNSWRSPPTQGIWLTLLERPVDESALQVLSLRVGLAAARALDPFAAAPVCVKWPNDLYVAGGKLAGVLVEARWRNARPEWVAIGVGVNVHPPREMSRVAGLREGTSRLQVLQSLVPALRAAASRVGEFAPQELIEYAARDFARGRRCVSPAPGIVAGVSTSGELAVRTTAGITYHRAGSLVLEEGA
jgi:BirA family biotin operon repressor/biotin-[acetyl-CoA-carboxylase] ligase